MRIWILNHYATNMYYEQAGRHYWFAKELQNMGHKPYIICASTVHNSKTNLNMDNHTYIKQETNDIPFIFLKTKNYNGNGLDRIYNMSEFSFKLVKLAKEMSIEYGKPDIILASSAHPLTLLAGLRIAKKMGVPCITEVRDLWPESLVAYDILSKKNPLTKILYTGEKYIYKKSDAIIMTWEGGYKYIVNQGWDKEIQSSKVNHISNGLDLEQFDFNSRQLNYSDEDMDNNEIFKVVYTGSIRKVNNLKQLIEAAKLLREYTDIELIIFGDGDQRVILSEECKKEHITNVKFKGRVDKEFIPSILQKSDLNILHNTSTSLNEYGQSQNKLFEYLAAGKPILQTYYTNYNLCEKYKCGVTITEQTPLNISNAILSMYKNTKQSKQYGINGRAAASNHDFKKLTNQLVSVIDKTL